MKCSPVFCVCFLLVLILPITYYGVVLTRSSAPPCRLNMHRPFFEYEYYQDGDVIIGGLISAHSHSPYYRDVNNGSIGPEDSPLSFSLCTFVDLEEYRSMIVMMFTIKEINNNPDLLPNVTLGYRIFSTCNDPMKTLGYAIKILSGEKEAPNYYCKGDGEVAAFIGDSSLPTNHALAQLLSLYRYTQIVFASRT